MRSRHSLVLVALAAPILLGMKSCGTDPPPDVGEGAFILAVEVVLPDDATDRVLAGGMRETLEGLDGVIFDIERVDVVYRADLADASTEEVITVEDVGGELELVGDLFDASPRRLLFLTVPAGYVMQLRIVLRDGTILFEDGSVHEVTVPSGVQTGIKVEPTPEQVAFEIIDGGRTAALVSFNPFEQMLRNRGTGFRMKPVLQARQVPLATISPLFLDRFVVRYHDPAPGVRCEREAVEHAMAFIGATVIGHDYSTNYFVVETPPSILPEDALEFMLRSEPQFTRLHLSFTCRAEFALPDHIVRFHALPCDRSFQPDAYVAANADLAWPSSNDPADPGTAGSRRVAIAVVDSGFALDHPDLYLNWYINVDELPRILFDDNGVPILNSGFDLNLDNAVNALDLDILDDLADDDDVFSFVDLNDPDVQGIVCGDRVAGCDFDGDGLVTPLDLVTGPPLGGPQGAPDADCGILRSRFQDAVDNDDNGFCDDLVGWDFDANDNLPEPRLSAGGESSSHGTQIAGLIGATGAGIGAAQSCPGTLTAGMMWGGVRMLPVKHGGTKVTDGISSEEVSTRANAYLALRYAYLFPDFDIVNASFGVTLTRDNAPPGVNCREEEIIQNVDDGLGKWTKFKGFLGEEGRCLRSKPDSTFASCLEADQKILVIAAGNCPYDLDDPASEDEVVNWPVELDIATSVVVGGVDTASVLDGNPQLWSRGPLIASTFGQEDVDIAAPATFMTTTDLGVEGGRTDLARQGTSASAAFVSGALGLINASCETRPTAARLRALLLDNAQTLPQLADRIRLGRFPDVGAAVLERVAECP